MGYAYGLANLRHEAGQILADLSELSGQKYVSTYYFALICLGLGDYEQMYRWLERAVEERSGFLAFTNAEPLFDSLREEPRFLNLLRQIKPF